MQGNDAADAIATRNARNRRRQYIVNPSFQWKYVFTSAAAVFMISSVVSLILFLMLHQQARMRAMNPGGAPTDVAVVVLTFAGVFSLVTAAAVGLWCIVLTNRICGPLFMMERYLAEFTKGRIPSMRPLRKNDEFKGFHATLSRAFDAMKVNKARELDALKKALRTASEAIDADDAQRRDALRSLARSLESQCHAANEALGNRSRITAGHEADAKGSGVFVDTESL